MQAKASGEGERNREGRRRGEWERAMGTECLCKTKDREESGEEDIMVGMKQPGGQQERAREVGTG